MSIPSASLNKAIFNLRKAGHSIRTDNRTNPVTRQRYAAFVLEA
jgi:hypothetical protein